MLFKLRLETKKKLEGYLFISPWVAGFLVFFAFPIVTSLILSFSHITNIRGLQTVFVGWSNYSVAFTYDVTFIPMFISVVRTTLIRTPLIIIFSLIIAIFANKKLALKGFFRVVFFLPVLLGSGFVMQQLLGQGVDQQAMEVARGILLPNEVLLYLGPKVAGFVNIFLTNITLVLWKSGVQILLFLASLQGISKSLYEAAKVDSATEWEVFWKISLPMISPVILLNLVYTVVDSFNDVTNPIVDYIYMWGFTRSNFEYAAAMGWIYLVFIMLLIGLIFLIMRGMTYNSLD